MKTEYLLISLCTLLIAACTSKKGVPGSKKPLLSSDKSYFVMTEISRDTTYGYTAANPVRVGYNGFDHGPENEQKYLNGLAGPKGQRVNFHRISSCCPFVDKKLPFGGGLLDKYSVRWYELEEEKVIYIDMYKYEYVKAPAGFSIRK